MPTFVAAIDQNIPIAKTAETHVVTWQYRHPWITVQSSIHVSYKMRLPRLRLSGDENRESALDRYREPSTAQCGVPFRFYRLRLETLGSMLQTTARE